MTELEWVKNEPAPEKPDTFLAEKPSLHGKGFVLRAFAYLLDTVLASPVILAPYVFTLIVLDTVWGIDEWMIVTSSIEAGALIATLITYYAYYLCFEWWFGATPGKAILGMRVVCEDGSPCGPGRAAVRMVTRPIDAFIFGLVAFLNMKRPFNQRWGDKLAHTVVVSAREPGIVLRPWSRFATSFLLLWALYGTMLLFWSVLLLAVM